MISLPFLSDKRKRINYYLGLLLKENEGFILALQLKGDLITVKKKEKFNYSNGWENLIEDIDEAIFKMEKELKLEFSDTIFFVYSHLIEEDKLEIKKEYLLKIKAIVKNLDLNPLGYIESSEALTSYLIEKEQMPISSILIELDESYFTLLIYKSGKLFYRKVIKKTDSFIEDLKNGLEKIKEDFLLPARIILYDSKKLDEYSAKILSYKWPDSYFVQLPKIHIIKEDELIEALVKIFEEQIIANLNLKKEEIDDKGDKRFGFVINEDIKDSKNEKIIMEETLITNQKISKDNKLLYFIGEKLKDLFRYLLFLKKIKITNKFLFPLVFLFIGGLFFVNEFFFHKAQIIVYLPSKLKTKEISSNLFYKTATFSAEINEGKKTSGTREIGEKARGEVIIYNTNLNKEKIFNKGTEIETSGLKFVLDNDVKIATAESASSPGVAKVKVTAAAIGEEYNIVKGKRFNIDDTSYGESSTDFSGGMKKEIRTIAQKDIDELEKLILQKAKKMNLFPVKNYPNVILLPQLTEIVLKDKNVINGEVGEESNSVEMKAKVINTYFFVSKEELFDNLVKSVSDDVVNDFVVDKKIIDYQIKKVEKGKNQVNLNIYLKAKLIKKISREDLLKKIIGKNKNNLETILKNDFKVDGYNINVEEFLPILNNYLPFFPQNINLIFSNLQS